MRPDLRDPDLSVIRASRAGSCPRQLYYQAWGTGGLPPWEGMERAFAEGNLHEESILEWAVNNIPGGPWLLSGEQKELQIDGWLPGHIDGLAHNGNQTILLEAKCLARRAFQELRERGVRESHPQYYTQMQLYMFGLNEIPVAVSDAYIIVRNKETPRTRLWDHHYERVPFDASFARKVIHNMEVLVDNIQDRNIPDRSYHPDNDWNCRPPWCSYSLLCYPDWRKDKPEALPLDEAASVVEEYMALDDEIKSLSKQRDELKAQISALAEKGAFRAGGWQVSYTERRREAFDTKAARDVLSTEDLARLLKVTTFNQLTIKEA